MITRLEAARHNIEKRQYYLDKFNHTCVVCGSKEKLELDHIIAISMGGDNSEGNIQVLCKSCNSKKGGKRYRGGGKKRIMIKRSPFSIKIDTAILNKIKRIAKKNDRSVNAEIINLLKKQLK